MTFAPSAIKFAENIWVMSLDAAPWLLLGLLLAGMVKAWLPSNLMTRWLGRPGFSSIFKAALIGTPLPLCCCSILPAALAVRRAGASNGATVSFLIATPVNGLDSMSLSYVLLGPFMTVVRPVTGIITAILTGLLTECFVPRNANPQPMTVKTDDCCATGCCGSKSPSSDAVLKSGPWNKLGKSVEYALSDLLDDIAGWLLVGLVLAAAMATFVPSDAIAKWGSGLPAMLAMLVISAPMYVCSTASTPLAAALLLAGVSPGTVLVFLLAGPATNVATLGIVRRELGFRVLLTYVVGVCIAAVGLGLLTDGLAHVAHFNVVANGGQIREWMPMWLSVAALVILVLAAIRPLRRLFVGRKRPISKVPPLVPISLTTLKVGIKLRQSP